MRYDDAFTICLVETQDVENFRMLAGMVPFLQKLIADVSDSYQGECSNEAITALIK
jgi:hypothetical protein